MTLNEYDNSMLYVGASNSVTIHNSFVLCNCPFCKLQLRTVCDLSATMYVTYVCTVYTGHIPEVTHYGVVYMVGGIMEVPKIKGRD